MIEHKNILITGAAGSVGSELVRQLASKNVVYCLDNNETELFNLVEELKQSDPKTRIEWRVGDIRDKETIKTILKSLHFNIIFHCAAYKHVTTMEMNPEEAVYTNIVGTLNLVQISKDFQIPRFVFISTDKVVNYDSVMGVSKRMCELIVRSAGYVSVRFANVLGSRGSVIPIWQKQMNSGKPLTITDPRMERYFMSIEEAVELVISAALIGRPEDIIVLDMGKPVKVLDLAKQIIKASGKNIDIKEIGTRPGEVLSEELMTSEERKRAVQKGKFWIIKND